jgi:hypothetical protein
MKPSLNAEILQCIADRDVLTAKAKIADAVKRHYPQALIAAWQNLLNTLIQDDNHSRESLYPRQRESLSGERMEAPGFQPESGLEEDMFNAWKQSLSSILTEPPTDQQIRSEIERIIAAIHPDSSEIVLPQFPGIPLFLPDSSYSKIAYIEDNPDLEIAIATQRIQSWIDHLLRNGIPEVIQGLRYCRYALPQQLCHNCIILQIVDKAESIASSLAAESRLEHHPRLHPLLVLYACNTGQFYREGSAVAAGDIFYDMATINGHLLIRQDASPLCDPIHKWLVEIPLDAGTVIYGKSQFVEAQPFSYHDALLDDIVCGQIICKPAHFFAVFDPLQAYKSSKGFFCALVCELFRSGLSFIYKNEAFSRGTNPGSEHAGEPWSPFYSPDDVYKAQFTDGSDTLEYHAVVRADLLRVWQRHLQWIGVQSRWQSKEDHIVYLFTASQSVTILIPFKDELKQFSDCVRSIFERQERVSIQVLGINWGSDHASTQVVIEELQKIYPQRLRVLTNHNSSNLASLFNQAAACAESSHLLLMQSAVFFYSDYAITNLLNHHFFFNSSATGSILYDQTNRIQHNGFALTSFTSIAVTSPTKGMQPKHNFSLNQPQSAYARFYRSHECTALSAACMLVAKDDYQAAQGLDEDFREGYFDVEFCLKLRQLFPGRPCMCVTDHLIIQKQSDHNSDDYNGSKERVRLSEDREKLIHKHAGWFSQKDQFIEKLMLNNDPIHHQVRKIAPVFSLPRVDLTSLFCHQNLEGSQQGIATIFVHYDSYGNLDQNCQFYLEELSRYSTIYFVSSSESLVKNTTALSWLDQRCRQVLVRKNSGYDFGSWAHVIQQNYDDLCAYQGVLLVNDSVIGPLQSLGRIFEQLSGLTSDLAGLTASLTPTWHLQSYFIYYRQHLVRSSLFKQHWQNIRVHNSKQAVILNYELAWSSLLADLDFSIEVLFDAFTSTDNSLHSCWDGLIEAGYPFIKRELLRDNPCQRDLSRLPKLLKSLSSPLVPPLEGIC